MIKIGVTFLGALCGLTGFLLASLVGILLYDAVKHVGFTPVIGAVLSTFGGAILGYLCLKWV